MRDKSGEYTLIKKIGRGGMGQVWSAVRRDLMMPCAIKVLHPDLAETDRDRARFLDEARISAQLDHGRIVKVIDIGELQGCPFLVMDWVDGVNLYELLSKAREAGIPRLGLEISLFIVGEVLAALEYAHGRTVAGHDAGVIHYDVTPGNVMVSSSGEVKLTDLGIARFAATAGPLSRSVGTPRYMSPEQITGHPLRETDIYSLGVVLHELIEGTRYLDGIDLDRFRARVLLGPPVELTRTDVPEWLRRLVRQMLAVRPDDRPSASAARSMISDNAVGYQAASQSLQALYRSLIGEPRSGLTQLFESGEAAEQYGVSLADASLRRRSPAIAPAGAASRGRLEIDGAPTPNHVALGSTTLTGVPPRGVAAPAPSEIEPEIEPTIELPIEDMLRPVLPRVTLPMAMSSHAGPVYDSTPPTPLRVATQSETHLEFARPSPPSVTRVDIRTAHHPRWLVFGLTGAVLALGTALAWTSFANRESDVESNPAVVSSKPAVVADVSTAPAPRRVEEPPVEEPPSIEAPPVEPATVVDPPPPPQADPEPPIVPNPKPTPPKAKPARQEVVFLANDGKPFELKIGKQSRRVELALKINLQPGSHPIAWRRSESEEWQSCGTLVVELLQDKQYYDVKLGAETLSTNIRRRGGGP